MSQEQYNAPRPTVYCSLMNSRFMDCDTCREKTADPGHWKAKSFCVRAEVETLLFDVMKESRRNISINWANNYLLEKTDDNVGDGAESGDTVRPEAGQPLDPMGVHGETVEQGTSIEAIETEEAVGECYKGE